MPIYTFQNPKTGETIDISQPMTADHVYVDNDGLSWDRVFFAVKPCFDGKINPESSSDFVKKTAKRGMTLGDMWDESAALSEKRDKIYGKDPVKQKAIEKYEKKTGKNHPLAKPND